MDIHKMLKAINDPAYAHKYDCRCAECLTWWAENGPDPDESPPDNYGPFTKDEVNARQRELGLEVTP